MTYNLGKIYYTIWYFLLDCPVYIRYLLELFALMLLLKLAAAPLKKLLSGLIRVLEALVTSLVYVIQFGISSVGKIIKNQSHLASFEDKVIQAGGAVLDRLKNLSQKVKASGKVRVVFGKRFIVWVILYFLLILPEFRLERYLNSYYLNMLYAASDFWGGAEQFMTKNIDKYPYPFIKKEKEETDTEAVVFSEGEKSITYLYLSKNGKNGAYLRDTPEITKRNKIRVVYDADRLVYCGEKSYDGSRWWLKVEVNEGEASGWISANIVKLKKKGKTVGKLLEENPDRL